MLVEHQFVTTLEADRAFEAAKSFLTGYGYFCEQNGESELQARRGRHKPNQTCSVSELPQSVSMVYDRGRVEVAVSVREFRKVEPLHRGLALAVIDGLQQMLAHDGDPDQTHSQMRRAEDENQKDYLRRRRNRRIIWGVFVSVIVFFVVLIVMVIVSTS